MADRLVRTARDRLRTGNLGSAPVAVGLVLIAIIFQILNDRFLSAENLVNLALQMAANGTIALGIIMVLLLGEIDLSAGSVSGVAAAVMTILYVKQHWPILLAVLAAVVVAALIGLLHGLMFTKLGMPTFVVTLAGLLGWLGLMLALLGRQGTINLPFDHGIAKLSDTWLPVWLSWVLVVAIAGVHLLASLANRTRRVAAKLPVSGLPWQVTRTGALAVLLVVAVVVMNSDRGVPATLLIFGGLVVGVDLILRRTVFGRRMYAVGGNAEAARRAGINVTAVRILALVSASVLAGVGGVLAASRLGSVNQTTGGSDILLMAIAAAVIGGTSLFGGRGRAYDALFGILVVQSIRNGMDLLSVDSSVRYGVTAIVLAATVAVDSVARKGAPGGLR
jgi:D-xylose transport system permease protein